jgi:hypothetical protein
MLNKSNLTLALGLLTDFLRFHKKQYPNYKLVVDNEIKDIIKREDVSDFELEQCKL